MEKKPQFITDRFIKTVSKRLAENKQVRRSLPVWGRVHIDRQLPFVCIYRKQDEDGSALFERLIMGEASYIIAAGNRKQHKKLALLVKNIAQTLKECFGSFLIIEVWSSTAEKYSEELLPYQPAFEIVRIKKTAISSTIETFEKELKKIKILRKSAKVDIVIKDKITPNGLPTLLTNSEAKQLGIHIIGLEVRSIFKDKNNGETFPLIRQALQRRLSRALKNGFFEFTNNHTKYRPKHYLSLGRWSMVKAVWEVDKQLSEICNGFDFLLQTTPINSSEAWAFFRRYHYGSAPKFIYRPLPVDPSMAKRHLFNIPIERIEDPTLAKLFREQQLEIDRKLTMLIDRDTNLFMFGSIQLFGSVEDKLMQLAEEILNKLSPRSRDESHREKVDAQKFAARARQEIAFFKGSFPKNTSKVVVRDDITGLMVSQGNLFVGSGLKIPQIRMEALIQHEVGTHVLTYLNGRSQPFQQLYVGLAGYEELQEGLAVLSEYMVDGLTSPRMRLLAARVVAARHMVNGASFVDVFRTLNKVHRFEQRTAFNITLRTFRGGGLTKDAVYLRGLVQLLEYFKNGGTIEPLFVGKISVQHIPIIKELQLRKVLHPAPLKPRYLKSIHLSEKLNDLKNGLHPLNLIKRR